ncbi:MAG: LuxR C-terminal-related transcriptional regulator, partial [Dermatophilaceae bacterium]
MNYPGAEERSLTLAQDAGVIRGKILPRRLPTGAISRPLLIERLEAGQSAELTLLSAPAGYGKTTLLTAWLATLTDRRCAWVSLDARDVDPVRLWSHVIVALHGVEPRAGEASLAALRASPDQIEDHVLPVLLEELSGSGPDLVLILDDYHLAETVTVDSTVGAFLRYRPERAQLVISTRSDPALGIARLRAAGDLLEIRAEHLRFDSTEVARFLAALGVVGLPDGGARRLAESTGGWPAPLRLVALLVQDEEPSAFIESFTAGNKPVVEYLTTDVLELLEPDVQDFVLRTSILTRMSGALCDAVVGRSGSGKLLAELERSSLFVSVNTAGVWYTQHNLFAEAMRLELSRTQHELLPTLHLRAAHWFEQQGDLESATEHAIAARDVTLAARLVANQVESMAARGRWATVRSWLAELSWPAALADPELAWVRATSDSFGHDLDGAEQWLLTASKGMPDAAGALSLPLGYRVEMLGALVGINDVDRAEEAARRALDLAPGPTWEGGALVGLGQAQYLRGDAAEARATLRRAVALIPDVHPNLLVLAIGNLALPEYANDRGADPGPLLDRALDLMSGQPPSVTTALLHLALGERARSEGDPRGALGWYQSAIQILGEDKRSAWLANAHLLSAIAARALGDAAGELRSLNAADAILGSLANPGDLARRSRDLRHRASSEIRTKTEFGDALSDREIAVLELAGSGLNQREIADQLFISYN